MSNKYNLQLSEQELWTVIAALDSQAAFFRQGIKFNEEINEDPEINELLQSDLDEVGELYAKCKEMLPALESTEEPDLIEAIFS